MQLRSGVAVAVLKAGSCSSKLTPSLGTSICCGCHPKKAKNKTNQNPSKWIKDPNVRAKTTILLEQNLGGDLYNTGFISDFLHRHRHQKKKIDKLDFIETKYFCASKDFCHQSKMATHRKGENICKSYI